jgi:hypothetical protein
MVVVEVVGVQGGAGVRFTVAETGSLVNPKLLTARSFTAYVVPLVSPLITTGLVITAGAKGTQLAPPSIEYS